MTNDYPRAWVYVDDQGNAVLHDPDALEMIMAVKKRNCGKTFEANADRAAHFKQRITERGDDPKNVLIVILNVDDPRGGPLANMLMPGFDWQEIRDRGEIPFARGLAGREGIQGALGLFDEQAATKLQDMEGQVAVVVVDHGVAEVFPA